MREIFESTVQRLFGDLVTPAALQASEAGQWPAALWAAIEESGFGMATAPEHLGGSGASWDDVYGVVRAAGQHALPAPLPETLLANWLLGQAGIEALGGALSFAAAGRLTLEAGKVSGELAQVPWGRHVGHVVALASDSDGVPCVVALRAADASARALRLNLAGEPRDDLRFEAAPPLAMAPLPAHLPFDVLLLGGAMLRAAQIAGALQATLDMTALYASERVQFGRPIAAFQAIQHRLAVLAEHTACAMVASEAAFAESGQADACAGLAALPLMAAKLCASEAAGIAADTAHALHGAIGVTDEHALHFLTQRLWAWRSEYGSSTWWGQRIGRAVCAGGARQFWPSLTGGGQTVTQTTTGAAA